MRDNYKIFAAENLQKLCETYLERGITPALGMSVADMQEGKTLFEFFGGSELPGGEGLKAGEDTLFHVASVTKIITAILTSLLVERGKLTLQDPVSEYFPDFPYQEVAIYHLMTHTAGFAGDAGLANPDTPALKQEVWDRFCSLPRKYTPGSSMEYLSYYYNVIGMIIEKITGKDIQTFASEELFSPLGMERTGYGIRSAAGVPFMHFYSQTAGKLAPAPITEAPQGDSGMLTTAKELVRIGQLVLHKGIYKGERIFSEATADFLTRECTGGLFGRTPAFFTKKAGINQGILPDNASMAAVAHHGMTGSILFIDPCYQICAAITSNSERMHSDGRNYQRLLAAVLPLGE